MPVYYHGRNWDAPMTDDAVPANAYLLSTLPSPCDLCQESMEIGEDLLFLPYMRTHLECNLRSAMGDVQHLEGRCLCFLGSGNEVTKDSDKYETYREGAKAALKWIIIEGRGKFHD